MYGIGSGYRMIRHPLIRQVRLYNQFSRLSNLFLSNTLPPTATGCDHGKGSAMGTIPTYDKTRADARAIFDAAVNRVNPVTMMAQSLKLDGNTLRVTDGSDAWTYDLSSFSRVFATGMGKATARMALGLEQVLCQRLTDGLIAVKEGHTEVLATIRLIEASHPLPDHRSEAAAMSLLDLGATLGTKLAKDDLVIVMVSGGGSAILCAPADGLTLADKIGTTRQLLSCGATINEINCVRKHLSAVKGGRLAAALAPATVLTLVLSDVVGDDLDAIASGPTVPDPTTFSDALSIIERYGVTGQIPPAALAYLQRGASGKPGAPAETPKPGEAMFDRCRTVLIGTNRLAVLSAAAEARRLGYNTIALSSRITGEAKEIALVYLGLGKDIASVSMPLAIPACIVAGGETTVTLGGTGKGGRNQEMALAFGAALARNPKDGERLVFLSGGTDGNDGPTDAAGAIIDLPTALAGISGGYDPDDYLARNDSWNWFSRTGGLLITGPTNTNVCDIQVLLVAP